jgi:hypothetical protein
MAKIRAAHTPMRQLGLILEGRTEKYQATLRKRIEPVSARVEQVVGGALTPQQRRALDVALNTPDIALIQGPPGTGKTRVIAALQHRLAEEAAKSSRLGGSILLSSFQHEAVENAMAAAQVFGLPPTKIGVSRRVRTAMQPVERWKAQQIERLRRSLSTVGFEVAEVHRAVRSLARGYSALPGSPMEAAILLERVLALAVGHLPSDLVQTCTARIRTIRQADRHGSGLASPDVMAALRLVRAIRTDAASFADDGPLNARRAARWIADLDLPDSEPQVEVLWNAARAGQWTEGLAGELRATRNALLDRLLAATDAPPLVDGTVESLLTQATEALATAVRRSPAGVARAVAAYLEDLELDPELVRRTLAKYTAVLASTCQHAGSRLMHEELGGEAFETVIIDEAARANPLDLFIPMALGRDRIILVGDHRQLPHLIEYELERELEEKLPDVSAEWRKSLFERLFKGALRDLQRRDGIQRIVTLDTQFRMHPRLGRFVSEQFYEGDGEEDGVELRPGRPPQDFAHRLPGYEGRVAAWLDVPRSAGAEVATTSKCRPVEAERLAAELKRLMDDEASAGMTFGIIAFYRRQVVELENALLRVGIAERVLGRARYRAEYREVAGADGMPTERLRVGTVDEFQGREFDVVFVSVTRSNAVRGVEPAMLRRKFGHLMLPNRLCVAMSRQKRLLIFAGDAAMTQSDGALMAIPAIVAFHHLCTSEASSGAP